ncbi:MAG: glycosyltransferase family 39 protein, partial [Acidihalobacter sp.]
MIAPKARRLFYAALAATLILKLLFAAFLPMTGDEAYFVVWGMHPALGYYDHPPMVGWWLSALLPFGHAEWWLRMPAIALNTFIGWAIMRILRPHRGDLAYLTGALYLIAPVNLYNVLITTDTPVILFIFLTGWAYYRALVSGAWRDYLLAGLAVGMGMLSKYFEGLIAVALAAHWLLLDITARRPGHLQLSITPMRSAVVPAVIMARLLPVNRLITSEPRWSVIRA